MISVDIISHLLERLERSRWTLSSFYQAHGPGPRRAGHRTLGFWQMAWWFSVSIFVSLWGVCWIHLWYCLVCWINFWIHFKFIVWSLFPNVKFIFLILWSRLIRFNMISPDLRVKIPQGTCERWTCRTVWPGFASQTWVAHRNVLVDGP